MKSICVLVLVIALCGCRAGVPKPCVSSSSAPCPQPSANPQLVAQPSEQSAGTALSTPAPFPATVTEYHYARPDSAAHGMQVHLASTQQPGVPETAAAPAISDVTGPAVLPAPPRRSGEPVAAIPDDRPTSLQDALAIGLAANPDLITIRGTANVGAAAVDVAGVYPWNPFVQAQYLPNGSPHIAGTPGNASGQSNYYIWVMQRFELAHQRQHREDSAIAALGQIRWNIQLAELLNVAQTERLFFAALYQRQLRNLAADAETLSERLAAIIERRFQAGIATSVQNINTQVAVRQSRRQQELAEAAYQAALLALRQQLGMPMSAQLNLSGDLAQYEWFSVSSAACRVSGTQLSERDDPQLLAQWMAEGRPDVLAARSAIAMAREI